MPIRSTQASLRPLRQRLTRPLSGKHAVITLSLPPPRTHRRRLRNLRRRPTDAINGARYEEVWALHAQGWSQSAIAEQVGLHRDTVRTYIQAPSFPERQPRTVQPSVLDPF